MRYDARPFEVGVTVGRLKKAGRTVNKVVAAKATKDLDPIWGKRFMPPNVFVTIVDTLR